MNKTIKLSTQPYKGALDYYPEDMEKRNYLFNIWRETALEFGYEEYDTPILEDADLYRAKSGDELANTQLYNFVDKGGREVAIRPEMTPSLARLIANKVNELPKPIRWFSIDKFYRYEKPQRGRSREFFQLNLDIFGVSGIEAELEIFSYINIVMKKLKVDNKSWKVYINNRYLMDYLFREILKIDDQQVSKLARAIDNFTKLSPTDFKEYLVELGLSTEQINTVINFISMDSKQLEQYRGKSRGADELLSLLEKLNTLGMSNFEFKPYIMRGISYYTGTVIEMFDTGSSENPRAMFGGGRYDDLLDIFDKPKLPAFGIGWGNITMNDFLTTYNLYPQNSFTTKLYITNQGNLITEIIECANIFRNSNISTLVSLTDQDLRKQLSYVSKKNIPYALFIKENTFILRDMNSGEQFEYSKDKVQEIIEKIN